MEQPGPAEEAVAQAAAEGLTLEPSSSAAGYKGVYMQGSRYHAHPYVKRAGKQVHLGMFATAEKAALAVARFDARTDPPAAAPAGSAPRRRRGRRPQSRLATARPSVVPCNPTPTRRMASTSRR